ncbi:hypothetical protein SacglDRAFT_03860 [Saccharomonospora glauca K62]|uniref:Nudix hydrolase domain-containing protein n=2 Tax=Saccharomonospora glauca TaxID=40990 RepID=I1D6Y1_9PSEU|nr:hypothetical protein SacglDRAFT_03860 [Saccharomonospora glauca K62]
MISFSDFNSLFNSRVNRRIRRYRPSMDGITVKDIVLLLLGGLVGAWAERLLGRPWDRHIGQRYRRWRAVRQSRRLERELGVSGEFLVVGGEHVYVHQFSVRGFDRTRLDTRMVSLPAVEDCMATLPESLRPIPPEAVSERIERERNRIAESPTAWNEEKLGVAAVHVRRDARYDDPGLLIDFFRTDYATFSVVTNSWAKHVAGSDLAELLPAERLRHVLPGLSHSFGVNLTVVTADNQVILTRRSPRISSARSATHISANEGMRADDLRAGRPDPFRTAWRGIDEELGVDVPEDRIVFHSLILDAERYQWALLGHVDLSGTEWNSATVRAGRATGVAVDDWESDRLRMVPFTPDSVVRELARTDGWIAHGWVNLLLSAIYAFPSRRGRLIEVAAQRRRATR